MRRKTGFLLCYYTQSISALLELLIHYRNKDPFQRALCFLERTSAASVNVL